MEEFKNEFDVINANDATEFPELKSIDLSYVNDDSNIVEPSSDIIAPEPEEVKNLFDNESESKYEFTDGIVTAVKGEEAKIEEAPAEEVKEEKAEEKPVNDSKYEFADGIVVAVNDQKAKEEGSKFVFDGPIVAGVIGEEPEVASEEVEETPAIEETPIEENKKEESTYLFDQGIVTAVLKTEKPVEDDFLAKELPTFEEPVAEEKEEVVVEETINDESSAKIDEYLDTIKANAEVINPKFGANITILDEGNDKGMYDESKELKDAYENGKDVTLSSLEKFNKDFDEFFDEMKNPKAKDTELSHMKF